MARNLYVKNLSDDDRNFTRKPVDELKKYASYLDQIRKYYKDESVEFDYEVSDKDPKLIYIDESDAKKLELFYGEYKVNEVYEYNPEIDKSESIKNRENSIEILKRDSNKNTITLKRPPIMKKLLVPLNTYQIDKQSQSVSKLRRKILPEYIGLLKLFYNCDSKDWFKFDMSSVNRWFILHDDTRPGVDEQRKFVQTALSTPDFAFLEGPPGSGKTTVLGELVIQLIARGKRILFCASTHVAVDNLLERLASDENKKFTEYLMPLRVGNSPKISDIIKDYQYEVITDQAKLIEKLKNKNSNSQKTLLDLLDTKTNVMDTASRHYANLVCGTTIGLAKYLKEEIDDSFDYMIIDEASKTTFQEFLVPAIHAKRWVIVGDVNQLTPHTDQDEIAANVSACIDKNIGECCLDVFMAYKKKNIVVVACDQNTKDLYQRQYEKYAKNYNLKFYDIDKSNIPNDIYEKAHGKIIVGLPDSIARININKIGAILQPTDDRNFIVRNYESIIKSKHMRNMKSAWEKLYTSPNEIEDYTWAKQVSWRIAAITKSMEPLYADEKNTINKDSELLLPVGDDISSKINGIKNIALPSIIDLVQSQFINDHNDDDDYYNDTYDNNTDTYDAFKHRNVVLTWQHRMHSEVASFSHEFIYNKEALQTPDYMENKRKWSYNRYKNRCIWIDVANNYKKYIHEKRKFADLKNVNYNEAELIIREIKAFYEYARNNPKSTDTPQWDIAILSFYTHQFKAIRECLQKFTGQKNHHSFNYPPEDPKISIELRTVDSFQGHESDIVFLSFVKGHPTLFLNNPNRINVALTRARYQCVIVGNHKSMSRTAHIFPLKDLVQKIYHIRENDLKNHE